MGTVGGYMYRYTIGESSWEDYHTIELLHNKKYSKDEFLNICKQAYKKLSFENKKEIAQSYGEEGVYLIRDILVGEYDFKLSENITSHIHILDLFNSEYLNCEDCPKSYMVNGKIQCNNLECEFREFLEV